MPYIGTQQARLNVNRRTTAPDCPVGRVLASTERQIGAGCRDAGVEEMERVP
jgi:hypothetical protein